MSVFHLNNKLAEIAELVAKSADTTKIMHLVKTANTDLINHFVRQALTGLGIGTGLAIPAVIGGNYLMDRAAEKSKEQSEETWDRITRAALGAAGIGAGLYALSKITNGDPVIDDVKQASVEDEIEQELMHKVATCAAIDEMLSDLDASLSSDTKKLAEEIRQLNNDYLVELLREIN